MALLKCVCGYDQVSQSAKACPNCKNKMTDATTVINCPDSCCTEEFPKNTKICPTCGCNVKQMLQQENPSGKRNKMKLNKEGSKKKKKAKGLKGVLKKLTKWVLIAGAVVVFTAPALNPINFINNRVADQEAPVYTQEQSMNTEYSLTIMNASYAIHGNVDLGYFYLMEENNKLELIRTSPHDSKMHHAFENTVVEGVNPGSPGVTPLYRSAMMEEIVANGDIDTESEFDSANDRNFHITVDKDVLDVLLMDKSNGQALNIYTGSDGSTFTKLDQYLEAEMEAKNVRRR